MDIFYSPEFVRRLKKLPKAVRLKAVEKEKIFRKDCYDPRLRTHKLSGKLSGRLAFWIDFRNRIVFSFINPKTVIFLSVGGHDIYR